MILALVNIINHDLTIFNQAINHDKNHCLSITNHHRQLQMFLLFLPQGPWSTGHAPQSIHLALRRYFQRAIFGG